MKQHDVQKQFDKLIEGTGLNDYRDPIELAAEDFRVHEMARFMLSGEGSRINDTADYLKLVGQLGETYGLSDNEVSVAIGMCEDRILHEQT